MFFSFLLFETLFQWKHCFTFSLGETTSVFVFLRKPVLKMYSWVYYFKTTADESQIKLWLTLSLEFTKLYSKIMFQSTNLFSHEAYFTEQTVPWSRRSHSLLFMSIDGFSTFTENELLPLYGGTTFLSVCTINENPAGPLVIMVCSLNLSHWW